MNIIVSGPRCDYVGTLPDDKVEEVKAEFLELNREDAVEAEELLETKYGFIRLDDCEDAPDGIDQKWVT